MNKLLQITACMLVAGTASASLVSSGSWNGTVGLSTDGFGSTTNSGVISASAESGSTVLAAYLYTATFSTSAIPTTVTLNGNGITYTTTTPNATACCSLASHKVDVTSIVAPIIDGGAGGIYDFDIAEGTNGSNIDGHALVVVYENPSLPEASVGIQDGFASVTGDQTSINFADPLDPTEAGFFAEMRLGIGFSCCDQKSTVNVNGDLLTTNAGNYDDGNARADGSLITVGGFDDPLSPLNPSYAEDHERYDLSSFIDEGDTSIVVDTINASADDNIFLAAFYVSGEAGFNEPPPSQDPPNPNAVPLPAAAWLFLSGVAGFGFMSRRKTK